MLRLTASACRSCRTLDVMKSHFLTNLDRIDQVEAALSDLLPGQANPWLLLDSEGDAIAYLHVQLMDGHSGAWQIQADLCGRHFHRDADVIQVLWPLQTRLGGEVAHDA